MRYIAPEVVKREPYTKAVDWWGMGAVLYELLEGKPAGGKGAPLCLTTALHRPPGPSEGSGRAYARPGAPLEQRGGLPWPPQLSVPPR